ARANGTRRTPPRARHRRCRTVRAGAGRPRPQPCSPPRPPDSVYSTIRSRRCRPMDDQLNGAVVVVAGASSGLGLATAMAARDAGAQVVLVARDRERLDAARDSVGGDARAFALDVVDAGAVEDLFAALGHGDHVASFTVERPAAPGENTPTAR